MSENSRTPAHESTRQPASSSHDRQTGIGYERFGMPRLPVATGSSSTRNASAKSPSNPGRTASASRFFSRRDSTVPALAAARNVLSATDGSSTYSSTAWQQTTSNGPGATSSRASTPASNTVNDTPASAALRSATASMPAEGSTRVTR